MRSTPSSIFRCYIQKGIKYITHLRLDLSVLSKHKSKHSFEDAINPLYDCGSKLEITAHYLLHSHTYQKERLAFFSKISIKWIDILGRDDSFVTRILLYSDLSLDGTTNNFIITRSTEYILVNMFWDSSF